MEQNIQNMNVKCIDPLHFTFPLKLRDHVLTREMLHITLLSTLLICRCLSTHKSAIVKTLKISAIK